MLKGKIILMFGLLLFLFAKESFFDSGVVQSKEAYLKEVLFVNNSGARAISQDEYSVLLNIKSEIFPGQIKIDNKYIMLDCPDVLQNNNYSCGVWAGITVLGYYGIKEYADTLAMQMNTKPETGTEMEDIARVLNKYGLATAIKQLTITELKELIDHKIPVIVLLQAYNPAGKYYSGNSAASLEWGHYVTVIGYGDNNMVFEDPDALGKMYLSENQFKARWKGTDNYYGKEEIILNNYGIIAYGKKPVFPERNKRLEKMP